MPKLSSSRALLLSAAFAAASLQAQTHRVAPTENVTRAVSVYEWTGDIAKPAAARLVPVSLYIDKDFKDGGTYYARPVPLSLANGNIYSLERAGVPQGSLTVDYARHLQTAVAATGDTTDLGWFGYGTFSPMAVAKKPRALRASSSLPVIRSSKDKDDDDRPTFANRAGKDDSKSAAEKKADKKADKNKPDASVTADPDAASDDPDRPRLSKAPAKPADQTSTSSKPADPAPTDTSAKTTSNRADSRTTDPDDSDRPTLRHRDPKQAEADRKSKSQSGVRATGDLNDDPDRPNMRRGVALGIGGAPATQLKGLPADLHQMVAVSDPTDREPHPFLRDWSTPTEQAEILAKVSTMARQQLADYDRTNGLATPPSAGPTTRSSTRTPAARARRPSTPPAPVVFPLTGEQLTGYTLSYGGLPTFVYTATAASPATPGPTRPERYITVVAQQLPSGELQLALASVTDAAHLDRTPWFRLVDAVDPDAEHRASLLFELRGHTSRQFALYRIISAKADQIFVTHPVD